MVHAHAEDTLPFGLASGTPLQPVIHSGSFIGSNVPVWDIADKFGDTNLLVTNMEQGRDLAKTMAEAGGPDARPRLRLGGASRSRWCGCRSICRATPARRCARMRFGSRIKFSKGEIAARTRGYSPYSTETWRAWEYWATRPAAATC